MSCCQTALDFTICSHLIIYPAISHASLYHVDELAHLHGISFAELSLSNFQHLSASATASNSPGVRCGLPYEYGVPAGNLRIKLPTEFSRGFPTRFIACLFYPEIACIYFDFIISIAHYSTAQHYSLSSSLLLLFIFPFKFPLISMFGVRVRVRVRGEIFLFSFLEKRDSITGNF